MTPLDELAEYLRDQANHVPSLVPHEYFVSWLAALEQAQQNERRYYFVKGRCVVTLNGKYVETDAEIDAAIAPQQEAP